MTFSYANKKDKEHYPLPTAYLTTMVIITAFAPPLTMSLTGVSW